MPLKPQSDAMFGPDSRPGSMGEGYCILQGDYNILIPSRNPDTHNPLPPGACLRVE